MKIETVSADKFNDRLKQLIKQGYIIVSQSETAVQLQQTRRGGTADNALLLFGLITIPIGIGIPITVLAVVSKLCAGKKAITLMKA